MLLFSCTLLWNEAWFMFNDKVLRHKKPNKRQRYIINKERNWSEIGAERWRRRLNQRPVSVWNSVMETEVLQAVVGIWQGWWSHARSSRNRASSSISTQSASRFPPAWFSPQTTSRSTFSYSITPSHLQFPATDNCSRWSFNTVKRAGAKKLNKNPRLWWSPYSLQSFKLNVFHPKVKKNTHGILK